MELTNTLYGQNAGLSNVKTGDAYNYHWVLKSWVVYFVSVVSET
jgi:hypothetical protein